MNPKSFYDDLYRKKLDDSYQPPTQRDILHRFFLDKISDPHQNSRHEVTLNLLRGGDKLLDIGCWNGNLLESIRTRGLYKEFYGIDIVEDGVEHTKSKGFEAQVVNLNDQELPFPDEFFDGVTMLAVLEHLFDPYKVISEIRRVLRSGGEFVIDVPNVGSFTNRFRILTGKIPVTSLDPGWDGGHLHYFTKSALDGLLNEYGFTIQARKTTGSLTKIRETWISLLAGDLIYHCIRL